MNPINKFTQPTSRYPPQPVNDDVDNKELSFRSKGLTADDIHGLSSLLARTEELDLSDNAIDKLSRGFPLFLVALDLSSNRFANLTGFENLRNIRMLRLQHNKITSTWGLQECVHLEHLDLTHNRIKVVEGLELLTKLKTLVLNKNYIGSMEGIRSLSFNISLEELSLKGNKVTVAPNYRGFAKHLIASLKQLDGKPLYLRDGNRCPGYGVRFQCKNTVSDADAETVMTQLNSHHSASSQGIPPAAAHLYFDHSFSSEESVISASSSQFNMTKVGEDVTDLPWRRPPTIVPKDLKGKELYDTSLNISALDESKHKSRASRSGPHKLSKGRTSQAHRHHHHNHHHHKGHELPPSQPAPLPEKWDPNFIYESHGSPSKRVPPGKSGRGHGHGHGHAASGHSAGLSKTLLGSKRYDTPPPPPRKAHRYPLTLGVEGSHAVPLTDATVPIGDEFQQVPLLASPGMSARLSPKKSSSATPLFPGAEQYWEGHKESVEHQEQNMTDHFRDQVKQQHQENFKAQQHLVPPPPPLPSEKFADQYTESLSGSEHFSGSTGSSPDVDDGDDENSEDYSEGYSDEYYSSSEGPGQSQLSSVRSEENHSDRPADRSLSSQQRGTFFGLYSQPPPDLQSSQKREQLSPPSLIARRAGKGGGPVQHDGRATHHPAPSKGASAAAGGLTSQRRGTFFGLYKKEEASGRAATQGRDQAVGRGASSASHRSDPALTSRVKAAPARTRTRPSSAGDRGPGGERQQQEEPGAIGRKLTSQKRGTFFGLYKKDDKGDLSENRNDQNHMQAPPHALAVVKPVPTRASVSSSGQRGDSSVAFSQKSPGDSVSLVSKHDTEVLSEADERGDEASGVDYLPIEMKRDSPEELQNVLQQMYERKIETLRTLKATREHKPISKPSN